MRKIIRIGFPILCVGIILVTFWMLADIKEKAESGELKTEENVENEVENNIENTANNIKNSIENNIENDIVNDSTNEVINQNSVFSTEREVNLNKAIYILEQIVEDENVYYTDEGMEEERFIIAVRDKESTEAKKYYIVDIETGEVEIYY